MPPGLSGRIVGLVVVTCGRPRGQLMELAVTKARTTRSDIESGVCGEHGGDPASIALVDAIGLDYVSCSPYRVPIARLAAAQSALRAAG